MSFEFEGQTKKVCLKKQENENFKKNKNSHKSSSTDSFVKKSSEGYLKNHSANNNFKAAKISGEDCENRFSSFSGTARNGKNVTFDLDISDYYTESVITIRIQRTSYKNTKTIYEKKMTLKDFFLSSVDKMKIEEKNILENGNRKDKNKKITKDFEFCGKGLIHHQNRKILKIHIPKFPFILSHSTTSTSTAGLLSSISSFLNRTISNLTKSSDCASMHKVENSKSDVNKTEERTKYDVQDAEISTYQSNLNKIINIKNDSEDRVNIFLSFRLVSFTSCLYLQSALELIDTTCDGNDSSNDMTNIIDNNTNDNDNNNNNNNDNADNEEILITNRNLLENKCSAYYFDDNLLPKQISKMDLLSEFHFLIAYSNISVVSTVMSVLAYKSHLKSALLLSDSNSCNALDIALRRGEEVSFFLFDLNNLNRVD